MLVRGIPQLLMLTEALNSPSKAINFVGNLPLSVELRFLLQPTPLKIPNLPVRFLFNGDLEKYSSRIWEIIGLPNVNRSSSSSSSRSSASAQISFSRGFNKWFTANATNLFNTQMETPNQPLRTLVLPFWGGFRCREQTSRYLQISVFFLWRWVDPTTCNITAEAHPKSLPSEHVSILVSVYLIIISSWRSRGGVGPVKVAASLGLSLETLKNFGEPTWGLPK